LRSHAAAAGRAARLEQGGSAAAAIHRKRMLIALRDGDGARAVGALLDAGLEGDVDGDVASKVDEALGAGGLYELYAARLELRAEQRTGTSRGDAYAELAGVCAGPLASPERAIEAWIDALAANPALEAAHAALREHATSDAGPLLEALVRVAQRDDAPS